MKIKVVDMTYEQALAQPPQVHKKPKKPSLLFRTVLRAASAPDLLATHFHCEKIGMAQIKSDEPCLVVPFIIQINVSIQALLSHGIIKLIEFARLINPSFSRSNRLCNIPSGAHLIDESTHIFHFGFIVAQCGSACPDGLQNGHSAAHIPFLVINRVVKGLEAEHHPTVGVLGQSAHNIACSMHMAVDKTRQHHMMIQGDHFLSCIFR